MIGPALVAIAAVLWATDALFRYPTLNTLSPLLIVLGEHIVNLLFLLPFAIWKYRRELFAFTTPEWAALGFIGMGGSALASVMFTAAFHYLSPSVVILLQKLQPIIVVFLAFLILGERPSRGFFAWATLALVSGLFLSFPDLDIPAMARGIDLRSKGALYALGAAAIWAVSTVAGKRILLRHSPALVTLWRFVFGLVALVIILAINGTPVPRATLQNSGTLRSLLYMGLIPGLIAMLSYYAGMKRTAATKVTFIELLFPLSAVVLNTVFLDLRLEMTQIIAATTLIVAVTMISYTSRVRKNS